MLRMQMHLCVQCYPYSHSTIAYIIVNISASIDTKTVSDYSAASRYGHPKRDNVIQLLIIFGYMAILLQQVEVIRGMLNTSI